MNQIKLNGSDQFTYFHSYYVLRTLERAAKHPYTTEQLKKCLDSDKYENRSIRYCIRGSVSDIFLNEYSSNEIYDIYHSNFKIKSAQYTLSGNDKIYFKDSTFPSLLLGRLNTNIKRTTKSDNADIIVTDCNLSINSCFYAPSLIDVQNKIIIDIPLNGTKSEYVAKVLSITKTFKNVYGYNLKTYLGIHPDNYELYELYQQHPNKFVSTNDFAKQIVNTLPVLSDAEASNILYMLKSQDKSTVGLALGTLQYYNFFEYGLDIVSALITSNCFELPNNREAEYIYFLLGVDKSIIATARNYTIKSRINFYMEVLNKFVISPSDTVKEKVYTILRSDLYNQITKEYRTEFDRLQVTLALTPNDTNRETTSSSQEMEGK